MQIDDPVRGIIFILFYFIFIYFLVKERAEQQVENGMWKIREDFEEIKHYLMFEACFSKFKLNPFCKVKKKKSY